MEGYYYLLMVCRSCGQRIADSAIVCYKCGTPTAAPERARPVRPPSAGLRWWLLLVLAAVAAAAAIAWFRS